MTSDLTFNTIVFAKSFDERDGSERASTARGVNTPDKLVIKTQQYVDSKTKVSGVRYTARVDRHDVDANSAPIITSMYFVIAVPSTAEQAAIDNVVATFKAIVANADFVADVLNNEK